MKFQPQNTIKVANFIIELAKKNKKNVTNLQLQKILFFLQGYSLSHFRTPLIDGKFSKWKYGPVQEEVYHLFRSYGSSPIVDEAIDAFCDHGKLVIQPYSKVNEKSIGNKEIFNQISNFAYKLLNKSTWEIKTSKTGLLNKVEIKRYTVLQNSTGRYYVSLMVEVKNPEPFKKIGKQVGIDMGIADLAILSNGIKYPTFDGSYYKKKTIEWQRKYSRRYNLTNRLCLQDKNRKVICPRNLDSFKNWQKAQKMKARFQAKVANKRHDYLQKLTTRLVRQYDVIVIEDLRTKNLIKNHHLAKSISNAAWYLFRMMLEYKCKWYGKKLIAVDPKNTSRICSNCGYNSGVKPLNVREWTCPKCHVHHDRDINAAVNILNRAVKTA